MHHTQTAADMAEASMKSSDMAVKTLYNNRWFVTVIQHHMRKVRNSPLTAHKNSKRPLSISAPPVMTFVFTMFMLMPVSSLRLIIFSPLIIIITSMIFMVASAYTFILVDPFF